MHISATDRQYKLKATSLGMYGELQDIVEKVIQNDCEESQKVR